MSAPAPALAHATVARNASSSAHSRLCHCHHEASAAMLELRAAIDRREKEAAGLGLGPLPRAEPVLDADGRVHGGAGRLVAASAPGTRGRSDGGLDQSRAHAVRQRY